jgi:hypothetical protein
MDAASGTLETPRAGAALATRYGASRRWQRFGAILGTLVLAACSAAPRTPYTAAEQAAPVPNMADVRVFADVSQSTFIKGLCPQLVAAADRAAEPAYLALSGGGNGGAYGAGVLNGWTASGTRPEFILVSGVSTGAMIAPFAFLGSSYDGLLRELYTSGITESLITSPRLEGLLSGSGLSGNERLRELVARYVDERMLARIAAEYAKGRCLAIVTTDLDAQRAVVWGMGRIASYGSPAALKLFRDVLIASAAVPVVFPPVFIDAEANGRTFREMHVDGGLTTPVFTLPAAFLLSNVRPKRPVPLDIYVLINDEIYPEFEVVPESTFAIAGRSVSAMLKTETRFAILRTYEFAQANGLGFHVTYIGADGPHCGAGFDAACMRRLYEYGYEQARSGRFWQTRPPTPVPPVVAQP